MPAGSPLPIDIGTLIRRIPSQYPFVLVDRILEYDPKVRLVASKTVTASEEFFEGHFPGEPVMPGVLLLECLAQAAGIWLLEQAEDAHALEVHVVGIDDAKFRKRVVPGDELRLEVSLLHRRGSLCRMRGEIRSGDARVAEGRLLLQVREIPAPAVDETARVAPGTKLGPGVRIGPYAVIGPNVELGAGTVVHAHAVIAGPTKMGALNRVFPYASIGQPPQDLKYGGEDTLLEIGDRNTFREFVTVHRGTVGGGGVTRIGSDNLIMNYAHVAHDCQVGNHTILGNNGTLGGHVLVEDWATVSAFSAVHQFCRIGTHAFLGGATIATRDVLPYSKTVGNRAHFYGANGVGLLRRGFSAEAVNAIRRAFRLLSTEATHLSTAIETLEREGPRTAEVQRILGFLKSSERGVILTRRKRSSERSPSAEP